MEMIGIIVHDRPVSVLKYIIYCICSVCMFLYSYKSTVHKIIYEHEESLLIYKFPYEYIELD